MSNDITIRRAIDEHGPAFQVLTDMQKRFVRAVLALGGMNNAEAARQAGYAKASAQQASYVLMQKPTILEALREGAQQMLDGRVVIAERSLHNIVLNPGHKDHLKAVIETLNRSGLQFIQKTEVIHTQKLDPEVAAYIKLMAQEQGIDPRKYLGYDPEKVVDAQYTEVLSTDEDEAALRAIMGNDDD